MTTFKRKQQPPALPSLDIHFIHSVVAHAYGSFDDITDVWQRFLTIVNHLTDVTVISSIKHDFPGGGFSGIILLAESHAAIHTWPEYDYAWCELATCGDPVACGEFQRAIEKLWPAV